MDIEVIKKIFNDKFDKIEEKVDTLNNTLSEESKKDINREVIAYIAGFFDGEGYIGAEKDRKNDKILLRTFIGNTNLEILKRIKSIFKGNIHIQYETTKIFKKAWIWRISDRANLRIFLETILPYSTVKRSQIIESLNYLKNTTHTQGKGISLEERKYRELIYLKLQELKRQIYTQEEIYVIQKQIDNTTQSQEEFDEYVYAYIAGFFDAEGSIGAYEDNIYNKISLRVIINNTYPYILIKIKGAFGGNVHKNPKLENIKRRQIWSWKTEAKDDVKFFLNKIFPYSIVKKPQIELGLKFLETNNYQIKLLIADKLKKMKDIEYTDEEIKILNEQIKEMNIDKLQKTMMDF